ncbi:MAG: hypothetical protein HQL58_12340 [Magnetococcales bacterium]|nr:hypothetical protein [Magnetococcales bacterium]
MSNCSTLPEVMRVDATLLHQRQRKTGVQPLTRLLALFDAVPAGQKFVCSQLPLWFVEQMGAMNREIFLANSVRTVQTSTKTNVGQRNMARKRSIAPRSDSGSRNSVRSKTVSIPRGWTVTNGAISCPGMSRNVLFQRKGMVAKPQQRPATEERKLSSMSLMEGLSVAWELHRTIVNGSETTLLIPVAASMEVKKRT